MTDIDPDAIAWCARHLPFAGFAVAPHRPPLPFGDASFDLVYAISVFTHLDEEFQHAWLAELARVSRPGATLVLSTHGAKHHDVLPPEGRESIRKRGFHYRTASLGRFKLDGLPDFYQEACHTAEYVRREWSRHLRIEHHLEGGLGDHQDLVVARKEDREAFR